MSETIISVENLSKKYIISHRPSYGTLRDSLMSLVKKPFQKKNEKNTEEFLALRDVSFSIQRGERIGIIGRNGAGKSTLLKILSQITPPTTGKITLHGRVASLLEVGTGFHPELTGRENIFLNGAILGMKQSEIKKKFEEIVAFAEIEKFLDTPVKRYSSGMYVRLAFAVAAHLDSDILIVDEVLAVGDAQFQKKCMSKMENVAAAGRTIFFVSHNMSSIQALCSRVLLMDGGSILQQGKPHEIIQLYLGGVDLEYKRVWESANKPHNSSVALSSVGIFDIHGKPTSTATTDDDIQIVMQTTILQPDSSMGLTVLLYDEQHQLVFSSINNHEAQWYGKPMPKGEYRTSLVIPGKLLNTGTYSVTLLLFGKNFTDAKTVEDPIGFRITDGPSVRGDYYGEYSGVIRPLLSWSTDPITS